MLAETSSHSPQTAHRPCGLVPTYNNPETIRSVVLRLREHLDDVIVVDDGSAAPGRKACQELCDEGLVELVVREQNGGKGAAMKDGLARAAALGFSHALQVDADGQHRLEDTTQFLAAAAKTPSALVLGCPIFDESAPRIRRMARKITTFFIHLETGGRIIKDAMCGFRVYPVAATQSIRVWGDAMDFDPEISVLLYRSGVPVVNLPTKVRYISAEDGGVSNFRNLRDNALISWMHTRLCVSGVWHVLLRALRIRRRPN
ncbi:MAG: glycosyltransferase family 2 protein [Myxococcales bacterium]|nr:glycosyltransferase family 2 protein [Myxococcales bacterium]